MAISGWELVNESCKLFQDSDQFDDLIELIVWVPIFVYIRRTHLNMRVRSVHKPRHYIRYLAHSWIINSFANLYA